MAATAKKKATAKKTSTKKAAKKTTTKATTAKESSNGSSGGRKYSPAASKEVETEMKAMKEGKLKSGSNGQTVTNPRQAIAIGLSKARKEGKKIPPAPEK